LIASATYNSNEKSIITAAPQTTLDFMRRIGQLSDASLAHQFCNYLVSLSIEATADSEGDEEAAWDIWIRDENDVPQAKAELAEFEAFPQSERYKIAEQVEETASFDDQELGSGQEHASEEASPEPPPEVVAVGIDPDPLDQQAASVTRRGIPVTVAIIIISVIVTVTSNYGHPRQSRLPGQKSLEHQTFDSLSVVDPHQHPESRELFASIRQGQLWRLVTPMFLHAGEMQLLFNMLWIFFFGAAIERLHGSLFMLLLAVGTQIAGMLLQISLSAAGFFPEALLGSPLAIGASGAVYGLFGFLWVRPRIDAGYPNHLVPINVALMLVWWVVCMTPLIDDFSSAAPLGGLIAGVLAALASGVKRQ
jgi:GlpG protein